MNTTQQAGCRIVVQKTTPCANQSKKECFFNGNLISCTRVPLWSLYRHYDVCC